jgi:parallel beta-helix repeat protein
MKNKSIKISIFLFILNIFLAFNLTLGSESRTITVPDDFEKIQEAINFANNGDIISVRAGSYHEEWISVDKSVSIVGDNQRSIIYYHSGSGFIVTADKVHISGLTITNFESMKGYALTLTNVSNCVIENNFIENNIVGIYVYGYSSNNTIIKNILDGNERSIELINAPANIILLNNITGALVSGISLDLSSRNFVSKNIISDLADGMGALMLWISSNNTINRNLIFGGNLFLMVNCSNNILSENFIIESDYGVFVGNSSDNTFYQNYFINVTQLVVDNHLNSGPISENKWDNGIQGNYWSNYFGADLNSDGIGDSSLFLYEKNLDNFPLMNYPEITTKTETNMEKSDPTTNFTFQFIVTLLGIIFVIIILVSILLIKRKKNNLNFQLELPKKLVISFC